ncbi:MAG: citrate synthase, partial [Clostridiales bacterium]|nr:citrate synthase [Clostridiales bacterium]
MHKNVHILDQIKRLSEVFKTIPKFSEETYREKQVKRGLRDVDGTGVIAELT